MKRQYRQRLTQRAHFPAMTDPSMMNDEQLEDEREKLMTRLPAAIRDEWTITPKRYAMQVFFVGLLFGSAITLMIVGFALDSPTMRLAWPGVAAVLMISTKWLPWWRGDRHKAQLRRAVASEHEEPVAE